VIVHVASQSYWPVWSAWFLSNALTGLTMLPAFISGFAYAIGACHVHVSRQRLIEAALLGLSLCTTCAFAFLGLFGRQTFALPLYAPLPVLIWAALRFGAAGASVALTAVTFSAIWSVDRGTGPFLSVSPDANVLVLQIFVLFTAVAMLCLAASATALETVAQLHKALLASLQDHVAILDGNGVVLEVNDSWRRFAETSDVPFFHGVRAGDNYLAACQSSADYGNVTAAGLLAGVSSVLSRNRRRFEIEYEHDHDSRRDAYTMIVEALERADGGAVVIRSNVTTRRQAQMEIEEQRRQLSHLARVAVLGQLSGAFAHELNQPLTAILSNAEAAREVLRRRPDAQHHVAGMLDDIVAADRRASAVIHRLRALLKRGDRRIQVIDTKGLIEEVLELSHTELITRRIEVTSTVGPILPALWGDRVQLQQVLLNLILNGCEAMIATAESDRRLVLTAETDGPHSVHFAVRDSGTGIDHELMDRLFEPFVTTKPDGLGLGLSISRTIVAAHGGRLWASNNPDRGATMHCVLPVTEAMHVTTHSVVMPTFAAVRDE
jgi:C4-dicarboxylate-specific signal transduction histidine kinase